MPQNSVLPTYGAIYAFGDSLSDAGNLSLTTAIVGSTPVSPPYYRENYGPVSGNVFSNGPTWVQDLSIALKLGTLAPSLAGGNDFAYGGAETGQTPQNVGNPQIQAISLPSQIVQFQTKVPTPSANALYTVSIGANDLLDTLGNADLTAQQRTTDVNAAVANEISFVKQLVGDGARNLLVLAVPDLGKTPTVLQGLADGSGKPSAALAAEASQVAAQYNAGLASQLAGIAGLGATVIDAYRLIDAAVATPGAYGLTNAASPVWSGNYSSSGSGTLAATGIAAQDQYLFWDHLHPTETGHQAIAALAEQQLGGAGTAAQITQFYDNILQRPPVAADLASWGAAVSSGALTLTQVDYAIATSTEARTGVVPIVQLYTALGRAPDAAGLQGWVHGLEGGVSLTAIASFFIASPEGQKVYGTAVGTGPGANTAFVGSLYQEVLGRASDPAGAQGWASLLNGGTLTPGQVLVDFIGSSEAQARDATPVTNFLLAAGNGTANYGGSLFGAGAAASSPGGIVSLASPAVQPVSLAGHAAADIVVAGDAANVVAGDRNAVYGSGNLVTVNGFSIGATPATSDRLQFLAGAVGPVPVAAISGTFGSGPGGTAQSGLTATAASGILTFAGSAASTATLPQLLAAAGNILGDLTAPANHAAAFQYRGSTYLIETPAAPGAGAVSLASDHVFDLNGVTGVTALATTAHAHAILI